MDYVCKVGTPTGEVLEQTFSAPDESALRTDLEQKGYYLFSVRRGLGLRGLGLRRPHVPTEKLLLFAQELAALLKAGLPLVQSLDVMLERQKDPVFRRSLETVREKVKSGIALSDAFKAEGALYPPILSASLIAGERSGNLEGVLRRLVQYLRLTYGLRRKAVAAAVYPMLLFGMMAALLTVMMLWVIPGFKEFYGGMDLELPLITRVVMAFALFFLGEYANMILMSGMTTILFLGGWLGPFGILPQLGALWFILKVCFCLFVFLWVRATFPRYRYDQLMRLGWKVFLPLSLLWLTLTAAALMVFGWLPNA